MVRDVMEYVLKLNITARSSRVMKEFAIKK